MTDVLKQDNYTSIIPSANTLEEAINYIKKLYGTTEREIFEALDLPYAEPEERVAVH